MTHYFGEHTKEQLETTLRRVIKEGAEVRIILNMIDLCNILF